MNDCPNGDIRDLLPDLLHERLTAAEGERVEAHVRTCATCDAELGLLRNMRLTMRRAPAIDARAIAASIPAYRAPVEHHRAYWRAAAAIVAITVGGASVALMHRQTATTSVADVRSPSNPMGTLSVPGAVATPPTQAPVAIAPVPGPPSVMTVPVGPATIASGPELAMGGSAVNDLNDRELSALLDEIESLDALPSADDESTLPVTPLEPTGEGG